MTPAKRRIIDALKRRAMTGPELAARFELTPEAIRQHLGALAESGLVASTRRATAGPGRPPVEWALTDLATDLFPDRHSDLTLSLIEATRSALGEQALDAIVAARNADQAEEYRDQLDGHRSVASKAAALATLRTDEGYMAEVVDAPDGDGQLLIEHHCPICDAAAACQGLCQGELDVFRSALGPAATVVREQHLLSGDERCVYRIRTS